MYSEFQSGVFAKPKDESFNSSINQIGQSFGGTELYPSIGEKAANLLYFVTKNHSFVDWNKRIAAVCFIYFLQKNNALYNATGNTIISNEALASLTLFIATSKTEEAEVVKQLVISILNQNKQLNGLLKYPSTSFNWPFYSMRNESKTTNFAQRRCVLQPLRRCRSKRNCRYRNIPKLAKRYYGAWHLQCMQWHSSTHSGFWRRQSILRGSKRF